MIVAQKKCPFCGETFIVKVHNKLGPLIEKKIAQIAVHKKLTGHIFKKHILTKTKQ